MVRIGLTYLLHKSRYLESSCTVFYLEPSLRFLAFAVPGVDLCIVFGTQNGSLVLIKSQEKLTFTSSLSCNPSA